MKVLHFKTVLHTSSNENWNHLVRNCLSFSPLHIWSAPFLLPPPLRKEATTSANINQPLFVWHLFKPFRNRFWTFPLARDMDQLKCSFFPATKHDKLPLFGQRLRPKRLHCHRKTRDCKYYTIQYIFDDLWSMKSNPLGNKIKGVTQRSENSSSWINSILCQITTPGWHC